MASIDDLTRSVDKLAVNVDANRAAQNKRARRHLIAIVLAFVSILFDVFLTVVIFSTVKHNHDVEECRNARSAAFFQAERDKVQGQVDGLLELKTADTDRAKALHGFNQFINASQAYLADIANIKGDC